MSTNTDPLESVFEMQRSMITASQRALEEGVSLQCNANRMAMNALESQGTAQRRSVELAHRASQEYLDAVESVPGMAASTRPVRDSIDESFRTLLDAHGQLYEQLETGMEEGIEGYDELAEEYLDAMDSMATRTMDAHATVESRSMNSTAEFLDSVEANQKALESGFEEGIDDLEQANQEFLGQLESQVDRMEELQDSMAERFESA